MDDGTSGSVLELPRHLDQVARLHAFVADVVARSGWPASLVFPVQLCLEEAVSNVIRHGAPGDGDPAIRVTLGERGDRMVVACVEDQGAPFDPTQVPLPPSGRSLAEMAEGRHGVRLMRRFAARIAYGRAGPHNRLILEFGKDA